jgi:hypothetical protein
MSIVRLGNLLLAFFGLVAIGAGVGAVVCLVTGRFELVPAFAKHAVVYGAAAVAPRVFAQLADAHARSRT